MQPIDDNGMSMAMSAAPCSFGKVRVIDRQVVVVVLDLGIVVRWP